VDVCLILVLCVVR